MTGAPIGRRAFLALSAQSLLRAQNGKGSTFVLPPQEFLDPATEFGLYRLTDPRFGAWLPAPHLRFISRRGRFLLYTSDRAGNADAYRLDWHTGESRQLTAAAALDRTTPALSPDDRKCFYFDGPSLRELTLGSLRERELDRTPAGWERSSGFSLSADGRQAVWVERQTQRTRLRLIQTARGTATTVVESPGLIAGPQLRPGHSQVLYRIYSRPSSRLCVANLDGGSPKDLRIDPGGAAGQALWAPDGSSLIYLSVPADPKQLTTLRENTPEGDVDRLIAKTSQFASFGINGDASVFVGASRSLASPYLLLLLRVARRELTICEHRSSEPGTVEPVFSPDSQNVFFTSDRKGKRALYRARVEKFVEQTGEE